MLKEKDAVLKPLMRFVDLTIISAAFLIAFVLRGNFRLLYSFDLFPSSQVLGEDPGRFGEYLFVLLIVAPLWCYLLHRARMYDSWRTRNAWEILWTVMKASFSIFLISSAIFFAFRLTFISRLFFFAFIILGFLMLAAEKIVLFSLMRAIRRRGYNYQQILIIGTGRRAEEFIGRIKRHPEWGLRVIGAVEDEEGRSATKVNGVDVIGGVESIVEILHRFAVDTAVIVVPRRRLQSLEDTIHTCETEGVDVNIAVDLFDLKIAKSSTSEFDGIPLLRLKTTVTSDGDILAKRVFDLVASSLFLLLMSPIYAAIALVVKITSPGPVFFKQERIGLNKRPFTMFKFRTMFVGAQKVLGSVDIYDEIYAPEWKEKKLRCVTPFGKILRKFSLDELPQVFNVFMGDMSLVGPRPTMPSEVQQYESWHRRRFSMRPGVTCLWQTSGRREVKFEEWMKMDLNYLDNWSLWLDIKILLKTIPAVLFGTGAY